MLRSFCVAGGIADLSLLLRADFNPSSVIYRPDQAGQIVWSDLGIIFWIAGVVASSMHFGFFTTLRVYLIPYLW